MSVKHKCISWFENSGPIEKNKTNEIQSFVVWEQYPIINVISRLDKT